MSKSYKSFGAFSNLFFQLTDDRLALFRKSYPSIYAIFETFNFESCRQHITTAIDLYKNPANALGEQHRHQDNRGRPAVDPVLMFKICVIQWSLGKTDAQIEHLLNTDLSLRCLLDFDPDGLVFAAPDAKTLWKYRELFIRSGLFESFNKAMMAGLTTLPEVEADNTRGLDSSFAPAPVQHNSNEENKAIKAGKGNSLWQDSPNKKRHKDIDARWTKKGGKSFFGYKLHVKVSLETKYVLAAVITPANVHDSQVIAPALNLSDWGKSLFADSGYCGEQQELIVRRFGMTPCFCMRAYRGKELTEEQKQENRKRSSIRCRLEHVFGFIEKSMNAANLRSVGIARATALQHLTVLVYNLHRYCQLNDGRAEMKCTSRLNSRTEYAQLE